MLILFNGRLAISPAFLVFICGGVIETSNTVTDVRRVEHQSLNVLALFL